MTPLPEARSVSGLITLDFSCADAPQISGCRHLAVLFSGPLGPFGPMLCGFDRSQARCGFTMGGGSSAELWLCQICIDVATNMRRTAALPIEGFQSQDFDRMIGQPRSARRHPDQVIDDVALLKNVTGVV